MNRYRCVGGQTPPPPPGHKEGELCHKGPLPQSTCVKSKKMEILMLDNMSLTRMFSSPPPALAPPILYLLYFKFRKNAKESDPVKVDQQRQLAMKGLEQLMVYTKMNTGGMNL